MKKIACLLLILCILPACAFGDTLAEVYDRFAMYSELCGAPELPDGANRIDKGSFYMVEYRVSDSLISGFMETGNDISGGYVICVDPASQGDFLALCVAHVYTVCGTSDALDAYTPLLDGFLEVRKGNAQEDVTVGNMIFSFFPMKSGLAFNYSIIKK